MDGDYQWSSYGAAASGDKVACAGLQRLWRQGGKLSMASHRLLIFEEGSAEHVPEDGEKSKRVGMPIQKLVEVKSHGGRLPLPQALRLRVRYMTAGGVIGSEDFVRQVYEGVQGKLGGKRKQTGGVAMRYGEWGGVHALHDVRKWSVVSGVRGLTPLCA